MKNRIGNRAIYLDPAKNLKDQLKAVEMLFGADFNLFAERGFESRDAGPVLGDCLVDKDRLGRTFFSYWADGNYHWADGTIAETTFYVVAE
jgi:hypothetical protein